jgi:hypothetical protein
MSLVDDIDNAIDRISAPVVLGLSCWDWVIEKLPEGDEVTKSIRRQVLKNARIEECSIASLLGGKK